MVKHVEFQLKAYPKGFHLITSEVLSKLGKLPENGLLSVFIKHSSAGITINENADPDVRADMEETFNRLIPENSAWFKHISEGSDDMPAHIKSTIIGCSLTIPIINGRLGLGIWQGIYLAEFRRNARGRNIIASIYE